MKGGHFQRSRGMDPDLVDRPHKAAAEETRPSAETEMSSCQVGQDVVHEPAAVHRSCDWVAIREPPAGLTAHAGTIAANSTRSVMRITFPARAQRMM